MHVHEFSVIDFFSRDQLLSCFGDLRRQYVEFVLKQRTYSNYSIDTRPICHIRDNVVGLLSCFNRYFFITKLLSFNTSGGDLIQNSALIDSHAESALLSPGGVPRIEQ